MIVWCMPLPKSVRPSRRRAGLWAAGTAALLALSVGVYSVATNASGSKDQSPPATSSNTGDHVDRVPERELDWSGEQWDVELAAVNSQISEIDALMHSEDGSPSSTLSPQPVRHSYQSPSQSVETKSNEVQP